MGSYVARRIRFSNGERLSVCRCEMGFLSRRSRAFWTGSVGQIPSVARRAKLDARVGLSQGEQAKVLRVVHPDAPENPWSRGFVRQRNWLIVVLLLATGTRRSAPYPAERKDERPAMACNR